MLTEVWDYATESYVGRTILIFVVVALIVYGFLALFVFSRIRYLVRNVHNYEDLYLSLCNLLILFAALLTPRLSWLLVPYSEFFVLSMIAWAAYQVLVYFKVAERFFLYILTFVFPTCLYLLPVRVDWAITAVAVGSAVFAVKNALEIHWTNQERAQALAERLGDHFYPNQVLFREFQRARLLPIKDLTMHCYQNKFCSQSSRASLTPAVRCGRWSLTFSTSSASSAPDKAPTAASESA